MSILCRLIHVSDLHFGDTLSTPWYAVTSWIPGLETHSKRVAQALSDSVRFQHLSPPDPWHVIATGDLTTWGRPAAFSLVLTYLRSQIFVGGQRVWLGLNVPGASVIPGNHDIWSGTLLGLSSIAQIPPSTRADFAQFFTLPAPGATYPKNNAQFPYQLCLTAGPPAVYLYGLDSTRVDITPNPRWRNFRADGFVDAQQLIDLQTLVANEPDTPCVRIAAIHHPLAYRQTTGTPTWTTLLNLDTEVLPKLQALGFTIALSGHQHYGFVRQTSAPNTAHPPLWVFSSGTSTQTVRLSFREKQLLSKPYGSLLPHEQQQWLTLVQKCNEYRIYDFETNLQDPDKLTITVNSYTYNPNMFAFVQNAQPLPIHVPISQ